MKPLISILMPGLVDWNQICVRPCLDLILGWILFHLVQGDAYILVASKKKLGAMKEGNQKLTAAQSALLADMAESHKVVTVLPPDLQCMTSL